jgi:hypothetical protein
MSEAEAIVYVALIGAVVTPIVTGALARRGTKRELEHRVGTPNGRGNVVEMLETLLAQGDRLARLERHDMRRERQAVDHEARLRAIELRHQIIDQNKEHP